MIEGEKVDVYWNLHRNCYSVRARTGSRRVIAHTDHVVLSDVQLVVKQSGRNRVLKELRKNVHAVLRGTWGGDMGDNMVAITYDPYKYPTFVKRDSEQMILFSPIVVGSIIDGKAHLLAGLK